MSEQRLTKRQAAIVGLYTGILSGGFAEMHKLAEDLMERPVWVHEFADKETVEKMKALSRPLFLEICNDDES